MAFVASIMKNIFENHERHDVTFLVGPEEHTISAHRIILSAASRVFETMLYADFKEKGQNLIPLPKTDAVGFKEYLKFIYTNTCDITWDNIEGLIHTAEMYECPDLVKMSEKFMVNNVGEDKKYLTMFRIAKLYRSNLEETSVELISKNIYVLRRDVDLLQMSAEDLGVIFRQDAIQCSELELLKVLMKWGKRHCKNNGMETSAENIRTAIQPILKHVRFPLMTPEDFYGFVKQSGIFSETELLDILSSIYQKYRKSDSAPSVPYSYEPRTGSQELLRTVARPCCDAIALSPVRKN